MKKYDEFATIAELKANPSQIDDASGVYAVFYTADKPTFNEIGTGAHFKKRNSNVGLDILKDRWVEGSKEIYIGKATNLRSRIKSYLDFGIGKAVGHYGGRKKEEE